MLISATLQAGGLKILFIGDSITDGNWGSGDGKPSSERTLWDMNHIYGHGFMYLCASHYLGEYPQYEYEFFNRGISGNSLYDLEKRWQEDVLDINPDVLSILVGINDINRPSNKHITQKSHCLASADDHQNQSYPLRRQRQMYIRARS